MVKTRASELWEEERSVYGQQCEALLGPSHCLDSCKTSEASCNSQNNRSPTTHQAREDTQIVGGGQKRGRDTICSPGCDFHGVEQEAQISRTLRMEVYMGEGEFDMRCIDDRDPGCRLGVEKATGIHH